MFQTVALLICVPLLAFFLVRWLLEKNHELEDRRRGAAKLASKLTAYGLKRTPDLLTSYSVGDYPALLKGLDEILHLFLDGEEHVLAELDGALDSVLAAKLATVEGRAAIAAKLADAAKAVSPVVATVVGAAA